MTAQALLLSPQDQRDEFKRWGLAAAVVIAAHFSLLATYLLMPKPGPQGAPLAPAVLIDLAPAPVAPQSQQDITPGPETPEVVESQPEPVPQVEPKVEVPKVEAPAEIVLPEPEKVEEKPVEQKKVEQKKIERRPTSRATAAPRSQQQTAQQPAAPSPGSDAARAAVATWRDQVYARLQAVKRCPGGASGSGRVTISFTVDRSGSVVGKSLIGGSGNSAFDQEALSMVSRASPFPTVPAAQPAPVHLPIPINFSCH